MQRRTFTRAALATAVSYNSILGASERIRAGAIGTGGRCQGLMKLAAAAGAELAAVCDVNAQRRRQAKTLAAAGAAEFGDYRRLLEDKSIDAVIIGSPDHWHVPMLIDAVGAGKDVYIEKPLTRTIEEGQTAIDAVKKSGRVVQVGYQQRSYPHIIEARELIAKGELGKVTLVQSYWYQNHKQRRLPDISEVDWKAWLGSAPPCPPDALRYGHWRWFWDYAGGTLTDLFSHWLDTIQWIMGETSPQVIEASGGRYYLGSCECPDTLRLTAHYAGQFTVGYDSTTVTGIDDGGMWFRGTAGTMHLTRGGYELRLERDPAKPRVVKAAREGTAVHMENFLKAVKSRGTPQSDVESAVASANVSHWGNWAYRTGRQLRPGAKVSEFRPFWNGRDLSEFDIDTQGVWQAREGTIVGRHSGQKWNDFLRRKGNFGDFELKLKFRLIDGRGNSGVQFRSGPADRPHEVSGYQADIGGEYWGCLYDESRRNRVLASPNREMLQGLDQNGWNEYVVRAQGRHIRLTLNGVRTVDYEEMDPAISQSGFLALQVHSGPGIEVWFKELMIREL